MKERPIPFTGPMVRALLDGSKTQTRRMAPIADLSIKSHSDDMVTWGVSFSKPIKGILGSYSGGRLSEDQARRIIASQFCPYGASGDRLWVREAWRTVEAADRIPPRDLDPACRLWFEADVPHSPGYGKYRPGMFMPRWASRIELEVTGVRVERLQDISEDDARAEGARECDPVSGREVLLAGPSQRGSYVLHYRDIWEQISGPGSWDANPWVWVVEFKRLAS